MDIRLATWASVALIVISAAGCRLLGLESLEPDPGKLRILPDLQIPAGVGRSIGGYAFFGRVTGENGIAINFEIVQAYEVELPAGTYWLDVWTVAQSDAIGVERVPGGTSRIHREFGPPQARCSTEVDVRIGRTSEITYRSRLDACEILPTR